MAAPLEVESTKDEQVVVIKDEEEEPEKEYCKSYGYAFLGSMGIGVANFFASLVAHMGLNAVWAYWPGALVTFLGYHLYSYV